MRNYVFTLLMALVLNGGAFAQSHDSSDQNAKHGTEATQPQQSMMNMHAHMQSMQEIMSELREESDPNKFMALMQKHMASMQEGMDMMGPVMEHGGGISENSTESKSKENHPMSIINRMDMIEQKMMMNQMMGHMAMSKETELPNH